MVLLKCYSTMIDLMKQLKLHPYIIKLLGCVDKSERKDFLSELELMKQLKLHPYIVKLLGCVDKSSEY